MNWDALGAIGEIIGAVAVVATLIYLAVQIRQNTRHVQAQMGHDGWISSADYEHAQMDHTAAEVIAKAEFEPDKLTNVDIKILDAHYRMLFLHISRVEHMNSLGLEIYTVEQTALGFIDHFNVPTGRAWFESNEWFVENFAPNISARMKQLFEDPNSPSRGKSLRQFRNLIIKQDE
jgi:hypothetical protein